MRGYNIDIYRRRQRKTAATKPLYTILTHAFPTMVRLSKFNRSTLIFISFLCVGVILTFQYGRLLQQYFHSTSLILDADAPESLSSPSTISSTQANQNTNSTSSYQQTTQHAMNESTSSSSGSVTTTTTNAISTNDEQPSHVMMNQRDINKIQIKNQNHRYKFDRIYYLNLASATKRREYTESWLSKQSIPYERIEAKRGIPGSCIEKKNGSDARCAGISGLSITSVGIIDNYNTTGLTFILEDDYRVYNFDRLQESVVMVDQHDPDWDVIRWDCNGDFPDTFPFINDHVVRISIYAPNVTDTVMPCKDTNEKVCWFCGGTYAMLWKGTSVQKFRNIWDQRPYDDIDCRLADSPGINGYCIQMNAGQFHYPKGEESGIPKEDMIYGYADPARRNWVLQQHKESLKIEKERYQQQKQPPIVDRIYFVHGHHRQSKAKQQQNLLPMRAASDGKNNSSSSSKIPFHPIELELGHQGGCMPLTKNSVCIKNHAMIETLVSTIIEKKETAGYTLVLRGTYKVTNLTLLEQSISMVPDDWDVIRWDCQGEVPSSFQHVNDHVFRSSEYFPNSTIDNNKAIPCDWASGKCWYCGGSHVMLWKGTSVKKLRDLWGGDGYMDADCQLVHAPNVNSYCIQGFDVGKFTKR